MVTRHLMRRDFAAGNRQKQDLPDFMIGQDWEIINPERFQS